jgi:hypothetical protein
MTNDDLAADYLTRSEHRLAAVEVLYARGAWPDVVREAQELVELVLKAILRLGHIEPPRIHDVGGVLVAEVARLPDPARDAVERLAEISKSLRRDRELAFYGAEDLTPGHFYTQADATRAIEGVRFVVEVGRRSRATGT